jgi:hypothetical protein
VENKVSHIIFMYHRARHELQFVWIMELAGDHTLFVVILASLPPHNQGLVPDHASSHFFVQATHEFFLQYCNGDQGQLHLYDLINMDHQKNKALTIHDKFLVKA